MLTKYTDPVVTTYRYKPDGEKVTVPIVENLEVSNGIVFLKEIPDKNLRVMIDGKIEVYKPEDLDNESKFYVDYNTGVIFVQKSLNGQKLSINYSGIGVTYYPASRIYLKVDENHNVTKTLADIENQISDLSTLNSEQERLRQEIEKRNAEISKTLDEVKSVDLSGSIAEATQAKKTLEDSTHNAKSTDATLKARIEFSEGVRVDLAKKNEQAQKNIDSLEKANTESTTKTQALNESIDKATKTDESLKATESSITSSLSTYEAKSEEIKTSISQVDSKNAELKDTVEKSTTADTKLKETTRLADESNENLKATNLKSTELSQELKRENSEAVKNTSGLQAENQNALTKQESLTTKTAKADESIETLKGLLASSANSEQALKEIIASGDLDKYITDPKLREILTDYATKDDLEKIDVTSQLIDYAKKTEIPNSLSQLSDDETHRLVTDEEKSKWNSGSGVDLSEYAKKTDMPTKVSQFENDSLFQTKDDVNNIVFDVNKSQYTIKVTDRCEYPIGFSYFAAMKGLDSRLFLVLTLCTVSYIQQYATNLKDGKVYYRNSDRKESISYDAERKTVKCHSWGSWEEQTTQNVSKADLELKADKNSIPTLLSQLANDTNFKTETEIQEMIAKSSSFKKEVVDALPSTGEENVFYLVKDNKGKDGNSYLEYLWIDGKWELIGSTDVDLSGYARKSEIPTSLSQLEEDESHKFITAEEKKVTNLIGANYVLFSVNNVESFLESLYLMKCDFPELNFSSNYNFVFGEIPDKKEPVDYSKNVVGYDELRFSGIYQKKVVEEFSNGKEFLILKYNGEPFTPSELGNLLINMPEDGDYRCWIHKNMYIELESKFTTKWAVDLSNYSCVVKEKGKQLSTNDYTNEAKAKVDAIPADPKYTDTVQDLSGYAKKEDIAALNDVFVAKEEGKVLSDFNFSGAEKQKLHKLPSVDEFAEEWEKKANKTEIKTKLSEMTDDATHRLVTDEEKETWNSKIDESMVLYDFDLEKNIDPNSDDGEKLISYRFLDEKDKTFADFLPFIIEQKLEEKLPDLSKFKQQVILTQSEYNALSSTEKNDESKIYFIKG